MTHIYRALTGSPVPNASANGQPIPSQSRLLSHNPKSVINMTVCLLWATKLFSSRRGSLTPIYNFSYHTAGLLHPCSRGLTVPFLPRPTHINYISFYVLNRETFIGRRPKYKLTTHSSTLIMNDHIHAHTPNMLMYLCICNANVTANSHVTCMMHTTWNILINHTSCQVPCNIYRKHISSIHFMSIFIDIVVSCILAFINI